MPGKVIHETIAFNERMSAEGCLREERSLGTENGSLPDGLLVVVDRNVKSAQAVVVFHRSAGPGRMVGGMARIPMLRENDGQGGGKVVRRRAVVARGRNRGDKGETSL